MHKSCPLGLSSKWIAASWLRQWNNVEEVKRSRHKRNCTCINSTLSDIKENVDKPCSFAILHNWVVRIASQSLPAQCY